MTFSPLRTFAVVAGLIVGASAANAAGTTTYMQFTQQTSDKHLNYNGTLPTTVMAANVPLHVNSLAWGPLGLFDDGMLNFSAASDVAPEVSADGVVKQVGFSGFLTIIGDEGLNYLTVNFTDAMFQTTVGGSSGSFLGSEPVSNISITSDFFDGSSVVYDNFALSFSGFSQRFEPGVNFQSNVSGTFAGAVPEPATWGLMIAGFGMVGFAARRRRIRQVNA